jgi:hypothetical protein
VSEKEIANDTDAVLLLVTLQEGTVLYFIKAVRKRNISYYTTEVMYDCNGEECKIRHYKRLEMSSKFILDKN